MIFEVQVAKASKENVLKEIYYFKEGFYTRVV